MIKNERRDLTEEQKKEWVAECDRQFDEKLDKTAKSIVSDPELRLIGLSGPTCSGKTTTAEKLISHIESMGRKVHIVSIDDFYLDRDVLIARADADPNIDIDYDSIDTIDFDALRECVSEIFEGRKILIPKFNFKAGKRDGFAELTPCESDIYIFEGIQAIYPQVTELFRRYKYKSVYICVEQAICDGDVCFSKEEIRFFRRLVRDYNFRGASPEFTFYVWESVRENEEKNIIPNAKYSDYDIDSAIPCELGLLKPYLTNILAALPRENEYYGRARSIMRLFEGIDGISGDYIAQNSIYKEFIK